MDHNTPTNAVLITGTTYPHRRELRSLGCLWNRDREGYLIAEEKAERALAYALGVGLCVDHIVVEPEDLEPLTGDALRAYRQDRQTSCADRLRTRADAADRRAGEARNRVSEHERDFLRLGEPIKVGHHSEGRHRKLIARFGKAVDAEMTERRTAAELRNRADWIAPARIAGDAERQRQEIRDEVSKQIGKGDTVSNSMWGVGVVTKVNTKSFTVWYADRGFSQTVDKSWCHLVAKGAAEAAKPAPKFKAGDLVTVSRLAKTYPGIVRRRTSSGGYSVDFEFLGRTERASFAECYIAARSV